MNLEEFESFRKKRFIELEKEYIEGLFSVSVTENGHQWREIFKGNLENCKIIIDSFKKIGYKERKK